MSTLRLANILNNLEFFTTSCNKVQTGKHYDRTSIYRLKVGAILENLALTVDHWKTEGSVIIRLVPLGRLRSMGSMLTRTRVRSPMLAATITMGSIKTGLSTSMLTILRPIPTATMSGGLWLRNRGREDDVKSRCFHVPVHADPMVSLCGYFSMLSKVLKPCDCHNKFYAKQS